MMRALLILSVMMSVIPSSADARRYKRHHAHIHSRHVYNHVVHKLGCPSPPTEGLALYNMEPFNQQEEIKFTGLDISYYLSPMPTSMLAYTEAEPVRVEPKATWFSLALLILIILIVGMVTEVRKLYYLSRARSVGATPIKKPLKLMLKFNERYLKVPSSLT